MPLPNGSIGIVKNPILNSPFIQDWDQQVDFPPPPGGAFRITDASETRVTDVGDKRITD